MFSSREKKGREEQGYGAFSLSHTHALLFLIRQSHHPLTPLIHSIALTQVTLPLSLFLPPSVPSLTHSLTHSLNQINQTFNPSLNHSITQSLNHSITQSLNHSITFKITQSLNHSITHSFTHSLTSPPTNFLYRSLTHWLTHSSTNQCYEAASAHLEPYLTKQRSK